MSIWQTKNWGEMLVNSGQAEKIFEINGLFVEKRKVALGEYGLFVLGLDRELSLIDESALINLVRQQNALFVQIETINYLGQDDLNLTLLKHGYYKKFIMPYTVLVDLSLSQEVILGKMKQKGRYNIRLAEKKGINVVEVEKTDENIGLYYELMLETTSRDNFFGNTIEYYKTFLKTLDNSKLLFAYFENKVIAGGIFVFDKDVSIYYYGASTSDNKYRNLMAPYLLQWKAIELAKQSGLKIYDFLGVAGPDDKDSHLTGVTDFKLKLSPDIKNVSNSYIFINKKIKYFIINILKKMKSK